MTSKQKRMAMTRHIRENSFGWRFKAICARLDESMNSSLSKLAINLPQFSIMMVLSEHGNLIQSEIGELSNQPGYTITRNLDVLEEKGFVHRRPHQTSRRSHCVGLTKAGEALMPELFDNVEKINLHLLTGLEESETKQFGALLEKILETQTLGPS